MQAVQDNLPHNFMYYWWVLFVAQFPISSFIMSYVSGWHRLTMRFSAQWEPYGQTQSTGLFPYSVQMRFTNYNFLIRITAAEDALYLSVLFFLRICHPPLRVPWDEIQFSRTKSNWGSHVVLTLGNQEKIPMRISESMARKLGILERIPN
jgi:hypothetical protein